MGRRTSVSSLLQPLGQASLVSAPRLGQERGVFPGTKGGLKVAAIWPGFLGFEQTTQTVNRLATGLASIHSDRA